MSSTGHWGTGTDQNHFSLPNPTKLSPVQRSLQGGWIFSEYWQRPHSYTSRHAYTNSLVIYTKKDFQMNVSATRATTVTITVWGHRAEPVGKPLLSAGCWKIILLTPAEEAIVISTQNHSDQTTLNKLT